ncbi:TRAP transporter large permease subunit [Ruegeria sp. 2205SS24-7]|uniref:TRAP transporter large permease n=1 Tax=Ruegeria discodermiae TaxID=3064389 RepID=UPI002741BFEC|nr:TRAP transporter large permease subunit [Ruegeria sp. 2205SS24-7]MDP5220653.1 TRAP transporter large permease subunit [Ruegeria sp. 2205SS24-7]
MEPLTIAILAAVFLFLFLGFGIPVGVAMGLVGVGGMLIDLGPNFAFGQLQTLPFAVVNDYSLAVLPMFVLMGVLAEASGVTAEVFRVADIWLRRMKGGLYQAVIVGSGIFAAISGSTAVNAVVFTRIAFPEMVKYGYSRSLSLGAIAGAGSFAAMIPPSITMVIYAVMTEQSVGQLLIAGVIPGLITAVVYLSGVRVLVGIKPDLAPPITEAVPMRDKLSALRGIWPIPVLLMLVLGGIYTGAFPPSAAGAVGAFGAFLYALSRKKTFKGWLVPALQDAAFISCILFIVLIGGLLLSRMLVVVGVIDDIVLIVTAIADTPIKFLLLVSAIYIVLGCFLDTTSMMVVTLPFFFPVTQELGIDPIWFGIVVTKLIEISVVTPPVGLNLFAVMGGVKGQATFTDIYKGVVPFILFDLIVLGLLIVLPGLATWLPQAMIQ